MAQSIIDAVKAGDFAAVTTLLKGTADIEQTDGDGETALLWAALKGDEPIVDLLLQHGADPLSKIFATRMLSLGPRCQDTQPSSRFCAREEYR